MTQLSETIDQRVGVIRASGHLTRLGADLLSATVDTLVGRGHTRVTLDLRDLRAVDDAGLAVLDDLQIRVADQGGELVLRNVPAASRG